MDEVRFSDDVVDRSAAIPGSRVKKSSLLEIPIKLGLAKTQQDALVVLVGVVIACLVLAGIALYGTSNRATVSPSQYQNAAQHAGLVRPQ